RTEAEGRNALKSVREWRPELVITDLRMKPMNGLELCRHIRAASDVPIIVVSGENGEWSKVAALDSGADDYVVKPFATSELLARVRAALRRRPGGDSASDSAGSLAAGEFRIDLDSHRVYIREREVRLTPKEFELLVFLARRAHQVVPYARLLSAVWGVEWADHRNYLRGFMRQPRPKLEANPSRPRYPLTEPWVGYRFSPVPQPETETA